MVPDVSSKSNLLKPVTSSGMLQLKNPLEVSPQTFVLETVSPTSDQNQNIYVKNVYYSNVLSDLFSTIIIVFAFVLDVITMF